jgi:hypothetical protein
VLFILIAGLWAAFLLPSFFDQRNHAPKATTRDYARTKEMLASVAQSRPDSDTYIRQHAQVRRQRILAGMGAASVSTLLFATLLLTIKQRRAVQRTIVVQIPSVAQRQLAAVPTQESYATDEAATVRVIAG